MTPPSKNPRGKLIFYTGLRTLEALWRSRPADIVTIYLSKDRLSDLGPILKELGKSKRPYHVVDRKIIAEKAGTLHHEDVCVLAPQKPLYEFSKWRELIQKAEVKRMSLILLDDVKNPHNVGAAVRTAAFFGVRAVLGSKGSLPQVSEAMMRMSEGGAEFVDLVQFDNEDLALSQLKKLGFTVIGTDSEAKDDMAKWFIGQKGKLSKVVFVFGSEATGMSSKLRKQCDVILKISGSGTLQSLNVAASTAAALSLANALL